MRNTKSQDVGHNVCADVGNHQHTHPPLQMRCGVVERTDEDTTGDQTRIKYAHHEASAEDS